MTYAVALYDFVKALHIMAVVGAFGLPLAYPLLVPYARRSHPRAMPAVHDIQHRLNNRVTALSVCAELSALGDPDAFTDGLLSTEVSRLQRVGALLGLLPVRQQAAEALELGPVLDDAIALYAHHPRARGVTCIVERQGTVEPVRVPRWALLRAMLLLVQAATAEGAGVDRPVVVLQPDGEAFAQLRVVARGELGPYAAEVVARCDGQVARVGEEVVLTVPTLASLRQQERERDRGAAAPG
jgi:hypothetical protein